MMKSETIKKDFPVFAHHPDLVYLDSAATALKPRTVIEQEREYLEEYPANISRGLYTLSERATFEYERSREAVALWIGALKEEIIFTKGTTESLNLLAYSLERSTTKDDEILVTTMDHHANFLPWQALAERAGATFRALPVSRSGEIDLETLETSVSARTKIFAFPWISNVSGTISPVQDIVSVVRKRSPEVIIILDAAQAAAHLPIDVSTLGVDFLAFSAHKCFGPTGVGVLWGRFALLEALPPFLYGGDMVESASVEKSFFKRPPQLFEAGTPNISGVIAFRAAIEYIEHLGKESIRAHESHLVEVAREKLRTEIEGVELLGSSHPTKHSNLVSFTIPGLHAHDAAEWLANKNICVRAGAHCAHPFHTSLGIPATIRFSFSIYNDESDINRTLVSLKEAIEYYRLTKKGEKEK